MLDDLVLLVDELSVDLSPGVSAALVCDAGPQGFAEERIAKIEHDGFEFQLHFVDGGRGRLGSDVKSLEVDFAICHQIISGALVSVVGCKDAYRHRE